MMPDLLNQQDEFIAMLDQYGKAYKKVNDFKEKLEELLK